MEVERDHLQRQLAQAHKMESVGPGGRHCARLQQPLTVINGYTHMLLSDLPAEMMRESIEEIQKAGSAPPD
jgi:hypothetical protein